VAPDARAPSVLTIAGSDSGGGAGIQADLKTFSAHRVHGLSALTALTAQNTRGVVAVHVPPPVFLRAQIEACFDDFNVAAVKVGMLATAEVIHVVADALERHRPRWVVLDPVMIATSGARLLEPDAVDALRERLLPMASVLTPNVPEAEALIRVSIRTKEDVDAALDLLLRLGPRAVVLKGGHMDEGDEVFDRYADATSRGVFVHRRLRLQAHGTGCSYAAAVSANLCLGHGMVTACRLASDYVAEALQGGYRPGNSAVLVLDHAAAFDPENKKAGE